MDGGRSFKMRPVSVLADASSAGVIHPLQKSPFLILGPPCAIVLVWGTTVIYELRSHRVAGVTKIMNSKFCICNRIYMRRSVYLGLKVADATCA
eukprot:COSAG02_NODE_1128_length_14425_cov_18.666271_2_plen_94_part_00